MEFKEYKRKSTVELHEYNSNIMYSAEFMNKVSISQEDRANGSPKDGDMIARNPKNHDDLWLVSKEFFEEYYELI